MKNIAINLSKNLLYIALGAYVMPYIFRWTHVVVHSVIGKRGVYNVVFIATADGRIRKMLKLPTSGETCLIEEIKIVPNGDPKPVKAMKIYPKEV